MKNFIAFICAMLLVSISLQAIPAQNVEKWPPGIHVSNDITVTSSITACAVVENQYVMIAQENNSVLQTFAEKAVTQNCITNKLLPDIRRLWCTHNSDNYQFNKKLPLHYTRNVCSLKVQANRCRAVI